MPTGSEASTKHHTRQAGNETNAVNQRGGEDFGLPVNALRMRFRSGLVADALPQKCGTPDPQADPRLATSQGEVETNEPPRPGDAWRIRWASGQVAGYAICCPQCKEIHYWLTAKNCVANVDDRGDCEHRRPPSYGSCWMWTGVPEGDTLSASFALDAREIDVPCSFVGLVRSGWLLW